MGSDERATPVPEPEFHNVGCWQPVAAAPDALDTAREELDEWLCEANLWLDSLFGDRINVDSARAAHGMLSTAFVHSERTGWDFKLRLRVRISLDNLEDRLSAFIGREPDADFVAGRSEGFALRDQFPVLDNDDQWLAGLGYDLPGPYGLRSAFKVGARRLTDTEIFARYQVYWNALTSPDFVLNLRLIPFWTNKDEFGVTTGFDYAYALSPISLLRLDVVATHSDRTVDADWRTAVIYYRSLAEAAGVAAEVFALGDSGENEPLREYGVRALLRIPLSRQRLFMLASAGPGWFQPGDASARRKSYFTSSIVFEFPIGH